MPRLLSFLIALTSAATVHVHAVPHLPTSDAQVLERLPGRATDPALRELAEWRRMLARHPADAALALRVARRYIELNAAEGDPRYIGYAQAALAPWWELADPPEGVRVVRAVLRQNVHQFDAALADLTAVVARHPGNGEAWSWLAAIAMVQARYDDARRACGRMAVQASALIEVACVAAVDSLTGRAGAASAALHDALATATDVSAAETLWALTRLAEIDERRGDFAAAEDAFRRAAALGPVDGYLLAAYADFLLDRGRPREVIGLLKGRERSDLLLLRLAIAAKAAGAPELAGYARALADRFDAARLRGDTVHQKEEARFALALLGQPQRALELAQANYAVQREPADARILLEAALAAGSPQAAAPALQWMQRNGVESVALRSLAQRLAAR